MPACDNVNEFPEKTVDVTLADELHLFCDAKKSTATVRWSLKGTTTTQSVKPRDSRP